MAEPDPVALFSRQAIPNRSKTHRCTFSLIPLQNSDNIVALPTGISGGPNSHCGQQVQVTYNGKTIYPVAMDTCESCADDHIDLSSGAMSQLDSNYVYDGVIQVDWELL